MSQQPETTQLTEDKVNELVELLKGVGYKRSGTRIFEAMWPIFPLICSEQAVVRLFDNVPHVLLWYRKDRHFRGWHMPGGYLLRGENDWEWCERVLRKEVGLVLKTLELIRRFNVRPRTAKGEEPTHLIANFFLCTVEGESTKGRFFPLDHLPKGVLRQHKIYIQHLRVHLMRRKTMRAVGIRYDGLDQAPENQWLVMIMYDDGARRQGVYASLDKAIEASRNLVSTSNQCSTFILDDRGYQIL